MSIRQGTRIAFTGAGGTGKTTSAHAVANEFILPLPVSASRFVYEAFSLTEEKVLAMTPEEQIQLQGEIFAQKIKIDQEFSYVSDRTILDHYAYCLAYCGAHMSNDQFEAYEEKTRTLMLSSYSHIFYFPWGYWDAPSDGVRSDSYAWQSQIDSIIAGYILRWNLPVVEVPQSKGADERDEFIIRVINGE